MYARIVQHPNMETRFSLAYSAPEFTMNKSLKILLLSITIALFAVIAILFVSERGLRSNPDALYELGLSKYEAGQYEEAIADFDEVIRAKPDDYAEAYYARGRAKYQLGRYGQAIADYDQAIRIRPDYLKAYHHRSRAKKQIGLYAWAESDYFAIVSMNASDAECGVSPKPTWTCMSKLSPILTKL